MSQIDQTQQSLEGEEPPKLTIDKELDEHIKYLIKSLTANSISAGNILQSPKNPRTILVCFFMDRTSLDVKYFSKDGEHGDEAAKTAFDKLEGDINDPGKGWAKYGTSSTLDISFGDRPARVYFLMLADPWKFATRSRDVISFENPVTNYYSDYRVIPEKKYMERLFSIYNNNPPWEAEHKYSIHCLKQIGTANNWAPTTIDPKFRNP